MIKYAYGQYLKLQQLILFNKSLCLFLNYIRVFIFHLIIIFLWILFIIFRFLPENESFFILLYIIVFFSSLFYIKFIHMGILYEKFFLISVILLAAAFLGGILLTFNYNYYYEKE
jgi:hypothetical protein